MRVSEQWLREWVDPNASTAEVASALTMMGLEVDETLPAADEFTGVCVGWVRSVEQHPNADRLRCCLVDVGLDEPLTIVCGAPNVALDQKVAVAIVGAILSKGFTIKRSKLRGEPSHGMICSTKELGMADDGTGGIMVLPSDAPVGEDLRVYLQLNDQVFDVDLTPNRGDCLSMQGMAREVAVFFQMPFESMIPSPIASSSTLTQAIALNTPECPRYVGRVIQQLDASAPTPLWMMERLRRAGVRHINVVVDVLNYVMLELGQPMHAFDLSTLQGGVTVRAAKSEETLQLLDDTTVTLSDEDTVIGDASGPIALAGVMGGLASAVTTTTTDVFLESAFFKPIGITKTARRLGMSTDASYRYARGVDPALQAIAIERATDWLLKLAGGQAGPLSIEEQANEIPTLVVIELRYARIERILGINIPREAVTQALQALDMTLSSTDEGWQVRVPFSRSDLSQEIDLIEEVARVHRFDRIPTVMQPVPMRFPAITETALSPMVIKQTLASLGYHEVITYSFIAQDRAEQFSDVTTLMALANPLSADINTLRGSLWPGMIEAMLYNQHRQSPRQYLFEMGRCFQSQPEGVLQPERLALLMSGDRLPEQWGAASSTTDVYDLKAHAEVLLQQTGRSEAFRWESALHPALHPGQSAALYIEETCVGHLGALHPSLAKSLGSTQDILLFEVDCGLLTTRNIPKVTAISKFPAVRRDLSLIFDEKVVYNDIRDLVKTCAGSILSSLNIFDIYQGEECGVSKKSIALSLTFQSASRTLVDEEINQVIDNIVKALHITFNATMRV